MNPDFAFITDTPQTIRRQPARRGYAAAIATGGTLTAIAGGLAIMALAVFCCLKIGLYLFGASLDGLQKRRES